MAFLCLPSISPSVPLTHCRECCLCVEGTVSASLLMSTKTMSLNLLKVFDFICFLAQLMVYIESKHH